MCVQGTRLKISKKIGQCAAENARNEPGWSKGFNVAVFLAVWFYSAEYEDEARWWVR